ncbi:hydrogenase expression/formation protein HypE [Chitinophaga costaii]|uniref:Hydrogenase expression/formation protein HypE n=2 Tax=Chitinophaga costaii TaxID=1335309 RepID=A0A1C4FJL2_9BACT|nr:hydrogenase expression/formation protein HypE [Chitinophaga costaii]
MQLSCPMPKLDFDIITLGHGSGGTLTNRLLESGVFNLLANPLLNEKHDGAIFSLEGKLAFSTDSYVIHPIFFPGGNIGELAVNGTVNDLSMCGALPKYLSLSFIIEEGLPMTQFWEILCSIKAAADNAGVSIITGDTKVVEKGKGDQLFINTSGIGTLHPKADIKLSNIKAGDKIIVSHQIAAHGMAILSVREGLEFETQIVSDTTPLHDIVALLLDTFGNDIHLLRDPTRGGVASVLNEIAKDSRMGIVLQESSIPVDDQVQGACELLGLDPLYVANEGVFLAIVSPHIADALVTLLSTQSKTSLAACIGTIVPDHPGQVILHSKIGGKRVVNMLPGEQLPRIC